MQEMIAKMQAEMQKQGAGAKAGTTSNGNGSVRPGAYQGGHQV